jgi:hypothetical protein
MQNSGIDLLLSGNSPLGEVLAAPSAPSAADRLAARDGGRWDESALDAFCGWASWHRGHAHDPRHRPDVIVDGSWPEMAWHRWTGWTADDARWRTAVIDTSGKALMTSAGEVERWVIEQRAAHRSGRLPLARGWAAGPEGAEGAEQEP